MLNPFEQITQRRLPKPQGEEVSGAFSCQEDGCYRVVVTARYLREVEVLTWICSEGHISDIKDFVL